MMLVHSPHPCKKLGGMELHYSNKNYSDRFKCSVCGNSRRFSLNFLGGRRVPMCDGKNIKAGEKLEFKKFRELKEMANI